MITEYDGPRSYQLLNRELGLGVIVFTTRWR